MKILDLVELNGERLHDANWMERLSLDRGPDCFCLLLAADTEAMVETVRKQAPLHGESALVVPPGVGFSLNIKKPSAATFIGAIFFELGIQDPLHNIAKYFALSPGHAPHEGSRNFFVSVNARFMTGNIFQLRAARHQTAAFLYSLAADQAESKEHEKDHAHVEKALSFMHMNRSASISLGDLCAYLNLSKAHFVRLFKSKMHMPPMKYFMRLKIHNASFLLMQGLSVKEAAEKLDFYSESHFSKLFKQYMGLPPRSYKSGSPGPLSLRGREADQSLLSAAAMISMYFDTASDMIFVKDASFIYRGCNAAFCQYVGKGKKEIFGNTDFTLFPKNIAEGYRKYDKRIFEEKKSFNNSEWAEYPDGKKILVEASKSPFFSPEGSILGIIGVSRAIPVVPAQV